MNGNQTAALERRIRQELEEQGLLTADEANVSQVWCSIIISSLSIPIRLKQIILILSQADDEILMELRRCQGELRAISQHNLQQLKRLHKLCQEEMRRQEIRKKLAAADAEVSAPFFSRHWRIFIFNFALCFRSWTLTGKWRQQNRRNAPWPRRRKKLLGRPYGIGKPLSSSWIPGSDSSTFRSRINQWQKRFAGFY